MDEAMVRSLVRKVGEEVQVIQKFVPSGIVMMGIKVFLTHLSFWLFQERLEVFKKSLFEALDLWKAALVCRSVEVSELLQTSLTGYLKSPAPFFVRI